MATQNVAIRSLTFSATAVATPSHSSRLSSRVRIHRTSSHAMSVHSAGSIVDVAR